MLKRISKIQGVGTFANCTTSGSAGFRKTTLIFGYNSHGKSTLTEVFRSLESKKVEDLQGRLSIPGGSTQTVQMTFEEDGKGESAHIFNGKDWEGSIPGGFGLKVFDSGFVNRNVLSGNGLERLNKESFSSFVLGEEGVVRAEGINAQKKELRQLKSEHKKNGDSIKAAIGVANLDKFVEVVISEPSDAITAERDASVVKLSKILESKTRVDEIKRREFIGEMAAGPRLSSLLETLQADLDLSLEDVHSAARDRLSDHVKGHMRAGPGARDWLQKGLDFVATDECPFCEQPFTATALDLIALYKDAFNNEFKTVSQSLLTKLEAIENGPAGFKIISTSNDFEKARQQYLRYPELLSEPHFSSLAERFEATFAVIIASWKALSVANVERLAEARRAIATKKASLFDPVVLTGINELKALEERFTTDLAAYNAALGTMNVEIAKFQAAMNLDDLMAAEISVSNLLNASELKLTRIKLDAACQLYSTKKLNISTAESILTTSQQELEKEQSEYLERFFIKINEYFKIFGSKDFDIEKLKDTRSDLPVYTLSVRYKKQSIDSAKLGLVFSESDKRALALSIFWASLSLLEPAEQNQTIVVLDDAVTSFDDNRMSIAIREMRTRAKAFRQMILLSHYSEFVRRLLELENVDKDFSFLNVEKDNLTSKLGICDASMFTDSEHHKKFRNISDFIARKKSTPIDADLRVYLEEEIRARFRRDILNLQLSNVSLKELIDKLCENKCFSDEVKDKLNFYREDLNSPHHVWTKRTPDDWGSFADSMLTVIYEEL